MTPKKSISEAMTARVEKADMDRRQFFIDVVYRVAIDAAKRLGTLQNRQAVARYENRVEKVDEPGLQ